MRINPIAEYSKYNEHRELVDKRNHKQTKRNDKCAKLSFSEVLKRANQNLYSK